MDPTESTEGRRPRRRNLALAAAIGLGAPLLAAAPALAGSSLLVKVSGSADADALAARHGLMVVRELPQIDWVELGVPAPDGEHPVAGAAARRATASAARTLAGDRAVRRVDEVAAGERIDWHFLPRDTIFNQAITLPDGSAQAAWHFVQPNFPVAWDITTGNPAVRVAVIDSEFDTDNPDLKDKLIVRYNASSGTAQYRTGDVKAKAGDQFHGSHTSGLVGARTDNGIGTAGACFDCGLIAIKIGGSASGTFVSAKFLGDIAEGLIYAGDNGASVINMSLGGTRPHAPLQDAINYARAKGAVVVASAGNSQQSEPGVANYPAAYSGVIAVAATDSAGQIAEFSTNGAFVDIAAPGRNVLSTTDTSDPEAVSFNSDPAPKSALSVKSGTSMAAPIVAGLAALMRSVRPDLSADELEALLRGSAKDAGIPGQDPIYGAGIIDAAAAVRAAQGYVRPLPPAPPAPPAGPAPAPAPGPAPAPAPAKRRAKSAKATVTLLRGATTRQRYYGVVSSKTAACRKGRTVVLKRKGARRALATATTDRRGRYAFKRRGFVSGRIQITVKQARKGRVLCRGASSPVILG